MKKYNLPQEYCDKLREHFSYGLTNVILEKDQVEIYLDRDDALHYDNYKFLAELFGTNKVDAGVFVESGGCPTCDGINRKSIIFTVSEVKI